jgi:hypothetical protein
MRGTLITLLAAVALALPARPAVPDGVQHPPPGQPDPYRSMLRPTDGKACCNGRDCGIAHRCEDGGRAGYLEAGTCWPLPPDRFVPPPPELARSPELHVCRARNWMSGFLVGVTIHCWTDSFGS